MKKAYVFSWLILISIACFSQAVIDSSNIQKTVYVNINHINADDANSGLDPEEPVKSLQKAIDLCTDTASRIVVYPGNYRSYIDINSTKLLIIEAAEHGKVFITGSDIFDDWQQQDTLYAHQWLKDWGYFDDSNFCFGPCNLSDYQKRRELVFINGNPVTQVTTKTKLIENTFFVDEENDKILLNPPKNSDMAASTIEVSTRGFNIYNEGRNGSLIKASVFNGSGLVLRGLTVQHTANTPHQDALTISETKNLLIENCIFQWNNGVGLEVINCTDVTIKNTISRHNGERGMGVADGDRIRITNVELYENNWRTNAPKIIAHDAAGIKIIGGSQDIILDSISGWNNYCPAIWFDWNNGNYTIKNSTFKHNQEEGIMLEASRKPARVENCTFMYNGIGIMGYGHANVTVDSCFFFANGNQISLGQDGRTVSQDGGWEINSQDWTIKNTTIVSATPTQGLFSFFGYFNPSTNASSDYFNTANADSNIYYHPSGDQQWPNGQSVGGGQLTLNEWRNATGLDIHSTWKKPSVNEIGVNEDPVAILEYEYFNDTIVRFFADQSYDPENLINSYTWYFGDGETSNKKNVNHYYNTIGHVDVSLVVTDFFGARDSVTVSIYIGPTKVKNHLNEIASYLYPNPVKENFFIHIPSNTGLTQCEVYITNHLGQTLISQPITANTKTIGPISATGLRAGIYFVTLTMEDGTRKTYRIVKE